MLGLGLGLELGLASACKEPIYVYADAGPEATCVPRAAELQPDGGPFLAPNGYYTVGNHLVDSQGNAHTLHGVDRPSLEWDPHGEMLSLQDYQLMASWNANVVRIALDQDFWLADAVLYSPTYAATVDQNVAWAHQAGLDVILDLHWSDQGNLRTSQAGQQLMADPNSLTFWTEVAGRYASDGRVLFELYNEPHDIDQNTWLNGGDAGYPVVGMQQLYDAVRATGAENVVLAGGLDWGYDLSAVACLRISGHNIAYVSHPYESGRPPSGWDASFGDLSATDVVVLTEFGTTDCSTDYTQQLLDYADAHHIGWTSWAWYVSGCAFPSLINDWTGTPSQSGALVKSRLATY
jgi:aryl-phospho-beta-D-glucosidase BglC (GH1 family)